jgi:hypothetical protein
MLDRRVVAHAFNVVATKPTSLHHQRQGWDQSSTSSSRCFTLLNFKTSTEHGRDELLVSMCLSAALVCLSLILHTWGSRASGADERKLGCITPCAVHIMHEEAHTSSLHACAHHSVCSPSRWPATLPVVHARSVLMNPTSPSVLGVPQIDIYLFVWMS